MRSAFSLIPRLRPVMGFSITSPAARFASTKPSSPQSKPKIGNMAHKPQSRPSLGDTAAAMPYRKRILSLGPADLSSISAFLEAEHPAAMSMKTDEVVMSHVLKVVCDARSTDSAITVAFTALKLAQTNNIRVPFPVYSKLANLFLSSNVDHSVLSVLGQEARKWAVFFSPTTTKDLETRIHAATHPSDILALGQLYLNGGKHVSVDTLKLIARTCAATGDFSLLPSINQCTKHNNVEFNAGVYLMEIISMSGNVELFLKVAEEVHKHCTSFLRQQAFWHVKNFPVSVQKDLVPRLNEIAKRPVLREEIVTCAQISTTNSFQKAVQTIKHASETGADIGAYTTSQFLKVLMARSKNTDLAANIATALKVIEDLKLPMNVVTYTQLIMAYNLAGDTPSALGVLTKMRSAGVPPNDRTFVTLLSGIADRVDRDGASQALAEMQADNLPITPAIHTCLLKMCRIAKDVPNARRLLNEGIEKGVVDGATFNEVALLASAEGDLAFCEEILQTMVKVNVPIETQHWNQLISATGRVGKLDLAFSALHRMQEAGVKTNPATRGLLLAACAEAGDLEKMWDLLRVTESKEQTVDARMITGVAKALNAKALFQDAWDVFEFSKNKLQMRPDFLLLATMLSTSCTAGWADRAVSIYEQATRQRFVLDAKFLRYLCRELVALGEMKKSYEIFVVMKKKGFLDQLTCRLLGEALETRSDTRAAAVLAEAEIKHKADIFRDERRDAARLKYNAEKASQQQNS